VWLLKGSNIVSRMRLGPLLSTSRLIKIHRLIIDFSDLQHYVLYGLKKND